VEHARNSGQRSLSPLCRDWSNQFSSLLLKNPTKWKSLYEEKQLFIPPKEIAHVEQDEELDVDISAAIGEPVTSFGTCFTASAGYLLWGRKTGYIYLYEEAYRLVFCVAHSLDQLEQNGFTLCSYWLDPYHTVEEVAKMNAKPPIIHNLPEKHISIV